MNERSSKPGKRKRKEHDFALNAYRVVQEAVGESEHSEEVREGERELSIEERHEAAVKLGRLGGKRGGEARAAKLTPEERSKIARLAASAR